MGFTSRNQISTLFFMSAIFAFILYHTRPTVKQETGAIVKKKSVMDVGKVEEKSVMDTVVKKQTVIKMETFVDADGNEVPIFNDETNFPKPGGASCKFTNIKDKEEYFTALEKPTQICETKTKLDGGYIACMARFKNKNKCVVLSFGISFDFKLEDSIIDKYGCKAYSFDPTMSTDDYVRKNGMNKFFNLGLSSFKGIKKINFAGRKNVPSKLDRYVNIVNMLGLQNTKIDFLKVDIEGSELDFFLDTASNHPELLENVEQIFMEFHNLELCCPHHSGNRKNTTELDMMKIVDILHCHGFGLAYTEMLVAPGHNFMYNGKKRSAAYVTTWIRI